MDEFGAFGLLITCIVIFVVCAVSLLLIWLFVASVVDVIRKDEAEFKDKTLWLVLLLGSTVVGLMWLSGIIYYFMFKPKLNFWE